jgi:hypothetical protein
MTLASPHPDKSLWRLPEVLSVETRHAVYREPRIYWAGTEDRRARQVVEFLVRTSTGLPIRALPPVLLVGDVPVGECRQEGKNLYRYFAYEPERLQPGAPISLGWPNQPRPRRATRFRYQPDRPAVS